MKSAMENPFRRRRKKDITLIPDATQAAKWISNRSSKGQVAWSFEPGVKVEHKPDPSIPIGNAATKPIPEPEFIATEIIQTIPDPSAPVADDMENWIVNGGEPPLDGNTVPQEAKAPVETAEGVVFPGVVAVIEEVNHQ